MVYQTYKAKPDFVFIDGDIVYGAGRIEEYRLEYFPPPVALLLKNHSGPHTA